MRILQVSSQITLLFLIGLLLGVSSQVRATPEGLVASEGGAPSVSCEDFAQRQIQLADRLLQRSNYTRALKVLNSTAENCDIEPVREKIVEVLGAWYDSVRSHGPSALQEFLGVLSNQPHVSSAQKEQFNQRIKTQVQSLVEQKYEGEQYQETYKLCRSYASFVNEDFKSEYYCGTSALKLGAVGVTMSSYRWLTQNWSGSQSLTTWRDVASTLEELYFLNGQFHQAYLLARERARRDPSPEVILTSLISARGKFLSPVLQAAGIFYGDSPSQSARSQVKRDLRKRVNFPKYVKAFYILTPDGTVETGMYGQEANQPSASLLNKAQGTVSLLQSTEDSNLAWLVSPLDDRYIVLEFGIATTPEESVRLETVHENIESDEQWQKLYDLEFTETSPATGSAVGTLLSGAVLANQDVDSYDEIFDDSSLLSYYCIQDKNGGIDDSYNFDQSNLGYDESTWKETSNTPALYHHLIQYSGQSVREVVWPKYVDQEWTGVVRVGLNHS